MVVEDDVSISVLAGHSVRPQLLHEEHLFAGKQHFQQP